MGEGAFYFHPSPIRKMMGVGCKATIIGGVC